MNFLYIAGALINLNFVVFIKDIDSNKCLVGTKTALVFEEFEVEGNCEEYFKNNIIKIGK